MSEVHRYDVVVMLSEAGGRISYDPHGPEIVMAEHFDRVTAERDALEHRHRAEFEACQAAERRVEVLEGLLAARESELEEFSIEMTLAITDSQIRSAMTVIGRSRFLQLLQAYNARIDAALKPAEVRCNIPACDYQIDMEQN